MTSSQYFSTLYEFHQTFRKFFNFGNQNSLSIKHGLLICGMGGSAIAGDFIRILASQNCDIPVFVYRGYRPPKFVDKDWHVLAISYSGNTEETITCVKYFLSIGSKITILTSGGKLEQIASSYNLPLYKVPTGLQPRDAFYHIFGYTAGLLNNTLQLGINEKMLKQLDEVHSLLLKSSNHSLAIASQFFGVQIVVLASDILYPAALRFRCQLNENSKLHASSFEVPEFSHNAIIGFDGNYSDKVLIVSLRGKSEDKRTAIHLDFAQTLGPNLIFNAFGDDHFIQLMSLVTQLDYISISLALKQQLDPHAIHSINKLKKLLRERN